MKYIVAEYRRDLKQTWYVAARPGWARSADGSFVRDGSFAGGPEWTTKRDHAFEFKSHVSAARVRSKCPSATIQTVFAGGPILTLVLLLLSLAFGAPAAPLPSFKHLPDYMVPMHCDPFSTAAVSYLQAQGVPARRILYRWSQFGGLQGFHAGVLFQWEGKFYFMDNARMGPCPVGAKTDLGCVNRVSGDFWTFIWMADENGDRVAPKKMADLFAPPPDWMKSIQVGLKQPHVRDLGSR